MRKFFIAVMFLFSYPTMASNYSLVGDWPYSFFQQWYTTFANQECGAGLLPINFSAHRDSSGVFVFYWSDFMCVPEGNVNIPPWEGSNPGSSSVPPPPQIPPDNAREYDPDFSNIYGMDGTIFGNGQAGRMVMRLVDRPDWGNASSDVLTNANSFNNYFRENMRLQADYVASATALSSNITARRIANLANQLTRSDQLNYLYHNDTASRLTNVVDSSTNYLKQVSDLSTDYLSQQVSDLDSKLDDLNNDVWSAAYEGIGYLWDTEWILWQNLQDVQNQNSNIINAIQSLNVGGDGGGGISEEFAAGLVGDYTGDDYSDSEAEGILGTGGLGMGDLEVDTISLDSVSQEYFSFGTGQCFEPLTFNFSVFGVENSFEIDLTPLCTLFGLVGVLLFIASNLLAVRIVVGAF